MHNVTHVVKGDILTITVDISEKTVAAAPPSATGKTCLVGTTSGTMPISGPCGKPLSFSLNVMAKH